MSPQTSLKVGVNARPAAGLLEPGKLQVSLMVQPWRELVDEHAGRIFGSAGDSVIAEFSSAVQAVRSVASDGLAGDPFLGGHQVRERAGRTLGVRWKSPNTRRLPTVTSLTNIQKGGEVHGLPPRLDFSTRSHSGVVMLSVVLRIIRGSPRPRTRAFFESEDVQPRIVMD